MKAALDLFGGAGREEPRLPPGRRRAGRRAARELAVQLDHRRHRARRRGPADRDQPAARGAGAERPLPQDAGSRARPASAWSASAADLTYRYEHLGAGAAALKRLAEQRVGVRQGAEGRRAAGDHRGAGRAAPTRRVLAAAAEVAGAVQRRARRLERLERAAHRRRAASAASTSASCPARAARRAPRWSTKGALDVLFLLGADEIDLSAHRRLRRLPRHPRRSRRAPGRRDPAGRRLHREGRPLRQHRGPGAARRARGVPEGRGAARTGRSCGRSPSGWAPSCPTTSLDAAARQAVRRPPDLRPDRLCAGLDAGDVRPRRAWARPGELSDAPLAQPDQGLPPHQPDRPGERHHGRVRRAGRRRAAKLAAE